MIAVKRLPAIAALLAGTCVLATPRPARAGE